jgi:hypothetical protein
MNNQLGIDQPYSWGRPPSTYLSPRQVLRLTILRSTLEDRHELRNRRFTARRRREPSAS